VLTIRYNVQEAFLARYIEPLIHFSVFVVYFGTALIASILGLMNPTRFAACWIAPYPLTCVDFSYVTPCVRGVHVKQAVLWMILVPSCTSVTVILVCLALVAATVWQQRKIIREQHQRLPQNINQKAIASTAQMWPEPTGETLASSQVHDSFPKRTADDSQYISVPVSAADSSLTPEGRRRESSKVTSSIDRMAAEAIVQAVVSGCTFVNSVFWSNLLYSFFIKGDLSKRNHLWVGITFVPRSR
jgi:heme exporter protein D